MESSLVGGIERGESQRASQPISQPASQATKPSQTQPIPISRFVHASSQRPASQGQSVVAARKPAIQEIRERKRGTWIPRSSPKPLVQGIWSIIDKQSGKLSEEIIGNHRKFVVFLSSSDILLVIYELIIGLNLLIKTLELLLILFSVN